MLDKLKFWKRKPIEMPSRPVEPAQSKPKQQDSKPITYAPLKPITDISASAIRRGFSAIKPIGGSDVAFDNNIQFAQDNFAAFDNMMVQGGVPQVPTMLANWYASQSFIGWQACASLAQHWLINKACVVPAEDAVRKGWDITLNDGTDLTPEQLDYIRKRDTDMRVVQNLIEYVQFARVFGVRVLMFMVDNEGNDYYEKVFNIDGVKPGSYRGMSQIDPYWTAPELDMVSSAQPQSLHFYEPTWWRMSNLRVHRSHLCTYVPNPVADVLKPTYFFGGVPLTQQIYEAVYNAITCSTEATQLMKTKRMNVLKGDLDLMLSNQAALQERMNLTAALRDNYCIKVIGAEETYEQHDTSLADVDSTILTQFQLVASIANIPPTKLNGQAPSGSLGQTGDYEEATYHEMLQAIQNNVLTAVLTRHYELLVKSEIGVKWPELAGAHLVPVWRELDAMTEQERADTNLKKSQTDQIWANLGALDAQAIQERIIRDPSSGYAGISMVEPMKPEPPELDDDGPPPQP